MKPHRAFTLIELLVVIAVIAVMIAVLIPGLSQAKRQMRGVACLSNLKQLTVASHVYAENNRSYYPIACYQKFESQTYTSFAWDFTSCKDWKTNTVKIQPGILWQGDMIEKVQQCPEFRGAANWLSDPYTGYNYNTSFIGYRNFYTASGFVIKPTKTIEVGRPYRCALFGDGQYEGGANKFMRSPFMWEGDGFAARTTGTQGFRHRGKTSVAYCDGSVRPFKRTIDQERLDVQRGCAMGTGFLSADNSAYDLR